MPGIGAQPDAYRFASHQTRVSFRLQPARGEIQQVQSCGRPPTSRIPTLSTVVCRRPLLARSRGIELRGSVCERGSLQVNHVWLQNEEAAAVPRIWPQLSPFRVRGTPASRFELSLTSALRRAFVA